jgi:hypothetical protein
MARKKKSMEDGDTEYTTSGSPAKICNGNNLKESPGGVCVDGDQKEDEDMEVAYTNGYQNGCGGGGDDMGEC